MHVRRTSILAYVFGCLAVLISCAALLRPTFFRVHDFTHAARLVEMHRALQDGQFPVRWSQNFGYGYGMPLFEFYAPLPYYLAEIPFAFGFSATTSLKMLLVFTAMLGFTGVFVLVQRMYGAAAAAMSASFFVLFPYRAIDMYVRGAWSELLAISLFPWLFYFLIKIQKEKSWKQVASLAIAVFALASTHNVMFMIMLPFVVLFAVVLFIQTREKIVFLSQSVAGILLGTLGSMYYLLPAYLEKNFSLVEKTILGSYFQYPIHFLYVRQWFIGTWGFGGSVGGLEDGISFAMGWLNWIVFGIAIFVLLRRRKITNTVFFIGLTLVSLGMTVYKSQFIWDRISLLQYVQFPWRFLSLVVMGMVVVSAAAVSAIHFRALRIVVSAFLIICSIVMYGQFFAPEKFLENDDSFYYTDATRIQTNMSDILPDYIPSSVKKLPVAGLPSLQTTGGEEIRSEQILKNNSHEVLVRLEFPNTIDLIIRRFYFPGWNVYLDGVKQQVKITEEGFQQVTIPTGKGVLSMAFENTPVRDAANGLSVIGWIGIGACVAYDRRKNIKA